MSRLGPGVLLVRGLGEIEAKAGGFEEIRPIHLWMALAKLVELPDQGVQKLVEGRGTSMASLPVEVRRLREWFGSKGLDEPCTLWVEAGAVRP